MQTEAAEAFDVSREPQHILDMYGRGVAGAADPDRPATGRTGRAVRAGLARRGQPWDSHDDLEVNHRRLAGECDQAIGALLTDLKQRGLLDETLVIWGGEFGRTPAVELPKKGRTRARSTAATTITTASPSGWPAAACEAATCTARPTNSAFKAVENRVHVHDLHATMLHLLGFDHERLTYRYAGRDFRLTDVHGNVVPEGRGLSSGMT